MRHPQFVRGDAGGAHPGPPIPPIGAPVGAWPLPNAGHAPAPGAVQAVPEQDKRTEEAVVAGESLNLRDLAKQAQEMRQRLLLAQAELAETEVTGTSGGGLVTVTMRVDGEVTRVAFDQAAVDHGDAGSPAALTLPPVRHATDALKSLTTETTAAIP